MKQTSTSSTNVLANVSALVLEYGGSAKHFVSTDGTCFSHSIYSSSKPCSTAPLTNMRLYRCEGGIGLCKVVQKDEKKAFAETGAS